MQTEQRARANGPGLLSLADAMASVPANDLLMFRNAAGVLGVEAAEGLQVIRDMVLLALDETEAAHLPEVNRLSARAALAEALDVLEGAA